MTSLIRKSSTSGGIGAALLACAALLIPAALLAQAGVAAAQPADPPDITVYHSLDGIDPRGPDVPPGCTPGTAPPGGGGFDSDSGFDSAPAPPSGPGGWVIVVGDVNASNNPVFYTNLLEGDTNVLSARTPHNNIPSIIAHYNSLSTEWDVTQGNTPVDLPGLLDNIDLLMFHQNAFDFALDVTAAEITAIANFVAAGGNLLAVIETNAHHANFNNFLSGIGSSIRFSTDVREGGTADVVTGAPFTNGMGSIFNNSAHNMLTGGTPVAVRQADGRPIAAVEQIGGPGTGFPPDCVLGGDSYEELVLWIDGGPDPNTAGTLCKMDEDGSPGGNSHALCGAALTFQLEGFGRFRKFITDPGIDTLVLGTECQPPVVANECILSTAPFVTRIEMIYRRGASDPPPGPRRLGSLIVDSSTNLDPANNQTLINVFGEAAGAKLQLRPIASGEDPEVIADSLLVPEPAQLVQLVSGLFGLAGLHRLRRRR